MSRRSIATKTGSKYETVTNPANSNRYNNSGWYTNIPTLMAICTTHGYVLKLLPYVFLLISIDWSTCRIMKGIYLRRKKRRREKEIAIWTMISFRKVPSKDR